MTFTNLRAASQKQRLTSFAFAARHDCFARDFSNPDYVSFEAAERAFKFVVKFAKAHGMEAEVPSEMMELVRSTKPQGAQKKILPFFQTWRSNSP
jgi:hypothetical protein